MDTKACNLNADEIAALIMLHGREMDEGNISETIERINYLNKRLKEFSKPKTEAAPVPPPIPVDGWGGNNGA